MVIDDSKMREYVLKLSSDSDDEKSVALDAIFEFLASTDNKDFLASDSETIKALATLIQGKNKALCAKSYEVLISLSENEANASLIGSPDNEVILAAHNLLLSVHDNDSKYIVSKLLMLLSFSNENSLFICSDELGLLTMIIDILNKSFDDDALGSSIRSIICIMLQNLSSIHSNAVKMGLKSFDLLHSLVKALKLETGQSFIAICGTIQNLSLVQENISQMGSLDIGLIQELIKIISDNKCGAGQLACTSVINLAIIEENANIMCSDDLGLLRILSTFAEDHIGEVIFKILLCLLF
jgi:hypothetical protein